MIYISIVNRGKMNDMAVMASLKIELYCELTLFMSIIGRYLQIIK